MTEKTEIWATPADELADLKGRRARFMERIQSIDDRAATIVSEMNESTAAAVKDWGHVIAAPPVYRSSDLICEYPAGWVNSSTLCGCGHTVNVHRREGDCEICHPVAKSGFSGPPPKDWELVTRNILPGEDRYRTPAGWLVNYHKNEGRAVFVRKDDGALTCNLVAGDLLTRICACGHAGQFHQGNPARCQVCDPVEKQRSDRSYVDRPAGAGT